VRGEPAWLEVEDAILFHERLIAAFGGSPGLRDRGLLESAMNRPKNVFAYDAADLFVLAAAYAHGIAKNHPFIDGNKRVAFTMARVFLGINGVAFNPPDAEAVVVVEGLAGSAITQAEFAAWLRKHSRARRRRRR
jgi:death-on-curing protein